MKIAKDEKTRQTLLKTTEKRRKIDEKIVDEMTKKLTEKIDGKMTMKIDVKMTMKIDEEN